MKIKSTIFILLVGIFLTIVASYMSIYGLSLLFGGSLIVILMASFLEISKITLVTTLHNNWNKLPKIQKSYMIIGIFILYGITAIGIFGYLKNHSIPTLQKIKKYELISENYIQKKTFLEQKKSNIDTLINYYSEQKNSLTDLLSKIQSHNFETVIYDTTNRFYAKYNLSKLALKNETQRISYIQNQISNIDKQLDSLHKIYTSLSDSLLNLNLMLATNNQDIYSIAQEVGTFYSIAQLIFHTEKISSKQLEMIINWFILILIFVFDPVALILILSYLEINSTNAKKNQKEKPTKKENQSKTKDDKSIEVSNQKDKSKKVEIKPKEKKSIEKQSEQSKIETTKEIKNQQPNKEDLIQKRSEILTKITPTRQKYIKNWWE